MNEQEKLQGAENNTGMEVFRREVLGMIEAKKNAAPGGSGHFLENTNERRVNSEFNIDELTEADKDIWQKVKDDSVLESDFYAYKNEVLSSESLPTREIFYAFIANKVTPIFMSRELLERKAGHE